MKKIQYFLLEILKIYSIQINLMSFLNHNLRRMEHGNRQLKYEKQPIFFCFIYHVECLAKLVKSVNLNSFIQTNHPFARVHNLANE
jgi:hypothetical protein